MKSVGNDPLCQLEEVEVDDDEEEEEEAKTKEEKAKEEKAKEEKAKEEKAKAIELEEEEDAEEEDEDEEEEEEEIQEEKDKEVNIDKIELVIEQGLEKITQCATHFEEAGLDKVQAIAVQVKENMEEFIPLPVLMRTLKNDSLQPRHWEAISDLTGIPVLNKNQPFKILLDQGIAAFVMQIVELGDLAMKEMEVEVSLANMQEQIIEHQVFFTLDPISGTKSLIYSKYFF
jgi:hypothetical protein